jgi:hypothetical protein
MEKETTAIFIIMKKIALFCLVLMYSCSGGQDKQHKQISNSDTSIEQNRVTINYQIGITGTPALLKTACFLIHDSLANSKEYSFLRNNLSRDSLINFINHVDDDDIEIKHFSLFQDTLYCDIFFPTIDGRFHYGKILSDDQNKIIFNKGEFTDINEGYGRLPIYSELSFKILLPKKFKYNKLLYRFR